MIRECTICYDKIWRKQVKTSCGHVFHYSCLKQWASVCESNKNYITCPVCRNTLQYVHKCVYCDELYSDVTIGKCHHHAHLKCFKYACMSNNIKCPCCNTHTGKSCMEIGRFTGWQF